MLIIILFSTLWVPLMGYSDDEYLKSSLIFPFRENYVLFVSSVNCTLASFQDFFHLWNITDRSEKQPFDSWTTNVFFSDQYNISYSNSSFNPSLTLNELFENSKTPEVYDVTFNFLRQYTLKYSCPLPGTTEFVIIFSDICLLPHIASINAHYSKDCPIEYRTSFMIMQDGNHNSDCHNSVSSLPYRTYLYSALDVMLDENQRDDFINRYHDREATYYGKLHTSRLNVFAVISNLNYDKKRIIYDYIYDKIASTSDCRDGDFIGIFDDDNTMTIKVIPIDLGGNLDYFIFNMEMPSWETDDSAKALQDNCLEINEALNSMIEHDSATPQYNALFLDDLACFNFTWNLTNRHLDIYVFDGSDEAQIFLDLIYPNQNISNHVTFITQNDAKSVLSLDTVCRIYTKKVPLYATANTDAPISTKLLPLISSKLPTSMISFPDSMTASTTSIPLVSSTKLANVSSTTTIKVIKPSKTISPWLFIGGIILGVLAGIVVSIVCFIIIMKTKNIKNKDPVGKLLNKKLSQEKRIRMKIPTPDVLIDFETILGKGSYSTVFKAIIKKPHKDISAAIKVPLDFNDEKAELLIQELDALIKMGSHPYITTFLGWSMYGGTPGILTELSETNLLDYVKALEGQELNHDSLYLILWQISTALEHLALLKIIHRDVACRNVLLTSKTVAKLADFGLSCFCDESDTYQVADERTKFPLRWLSIEALTDKIFSEKSDVWAFGILCYEMYTFGVTPYASMSDKNIINFLLEGNRLDKPILMSIDLYLLMEQCWKTSLNKRPTFIEISSSLTKIIENTIP